MAITTNTQPGQVRQSRLRLGSTAIFVVGAALAYLGLPARTRS